MEVLQKKEKASKIDDNDDSYHVNHIVLICLTSA